MGANEAITSSAADQGCLGREVLAAASETLRESIVALFFPAADHYFSHNRFYGASEYCGSNTPAPTLRVLSPNLVTETGEIHAPA